MKRDSLHVFRTLSGIRPALPSLQEALSGVTEHERRMMVEGGAGPVGSDIGQHDVKVGMIVGMTDIWNDKKGANPTWRVVKVGKDFVDVTYASPSGAWGRGSKIARLTWEDGAYRRGGKKAPARLVYPDPDYNKSV